MKKICWLIIFLLLWPLGAAAAPRYRVTDLGCLVPALKGTVPTDLNGSSWVVGYTLNAEELQRAFLWRNGSMQELGALQPTWFSSAFSINDSGQIVGLSGDEENQRAFLWQNGVMQDLGTLPGGDDAIAAHINGQGKIVGISKTIILGREAEHAFLWENGSFTDLGTLGGTGSIATDINSLDQVVGMSLLAGDSLNRAFLWQGGRMVDLGTLGGNESAANAVNDAGQVVGVAHDQAGNKRAFLWQHGVMSPLDGGSATDAYSINNQGQIVGQMLAEQEERPFLYEKGVLRDLNTLIPSGSGWQIIKAHAINSRGQIVGEAEKNGDHLGVLLTPVTAPTGAFTVLLLN